MPTYEYRCKTCGERFEVVQSIRDEPLRVCPGEGGPAGCTAPGAGEVAKVFSAPGITFKGSGFYKTDAGGSRSGSGSTGSDSAGSESKSSDSAGSSSSGSADSTTTSSSSSGD